MALRKTIKIEDLLFVVHESIVDAENAIEYSGFSLVTQSLDKARSVLNAMYAILTSREVEYHNLVDYSNKIVALELAKRQKMQKSA
jgi:hypothetical protein